MTCAAVMQWADDNRASVRAFLETNPTDAEQIAFILATYPDTGYITDLIARLPSSAISVLSETWAAADSANRIFEMNSVGPGEDQISAIPAQPSSGLTITIRLDGDPDGGAAIYFEGRGDAVDFFSHDQTRFDQAVASGLPWYSSGGSAGTSSS